MKKTRSRKPRDTVPLNYLNELNLLHVFNFSIPLLICVFSYLWKELFCEVKLFMGNMWELSLCYYFVPYKVNIPMYAGEVFYVFFVPYKVNISMYVWGFKQVQ
jgi:hypothetical protein